MPLANAVIRIDHHHADVLEFDSEHVSAHSVTAHNHYTRQHQSGVRTEHEFFGEVCDALRGFKHVVVTGSHTGVAAFRHYVEKHRLPLGAQIAGWEVVDHPSEGQLVAFARQYLVAHQRMAAPAA